MQISWNMQHRRQAYREDCCDFTVLFNDGETPPKCFFADEEAGEIECFVVGEDGRFIRDGSNPRKLATVKHRGKVRIVRKAHA